MLINFIHFTIRNSWAEASFLLIEPSFKYVFLRQYFTFELVFASFLCFKFQINVVISREFFFIFISFKHCAYYAEIISIEFVCLSSSHFICLLNQSRFHIQIASNSILKGITLTKLFEYRRTMYLLVRSPQRFDCL